MWVRQLAQIGGPEETGGFPRRKPKEIVLLIALLCSPDNVAMKLLYSIGPPRSLYEMHKTCGIITQMIDLNISASINVVFLLAINFMFVLIINILFCGKNIFVKYVYGIPKPIYVTWVFEK